MFGSLHLGSWVSEGMNSRQPGSMCAPDEFRGQPGARAASCASGHWGWVGGPGEGAFSLPTLIASQERETERKVDCD